MIPEFPPEAMAPEVRRALDFALINFGVCENHPGSNRGPGIDAWARELGSPVGSYWCALAVSKARREGGLWIPSHDAGSCDEWYYQATRADLVTDVPEPGAAVLYTNWRMIQGGRYDRQPDAVHIGLVLRVSPILFSIEGNTTIAPSDGAGYVQTLKKVDPRRVLAYVKSGVAA